MNPLRKYRQWHECGFRRLDALILAVKHINLLISIWSLSVKKKSKFPFLPRRISRSERLEQASNDVWAKNAPTASPPDDAAHADSLRSLREIAGQVRSNAADSSPKVRLGQIAGVLGFPLTADFLRTLGFEPVARDKAAVLYRESDIDSICDALILYIEAIQEKRAA